MTEKYFVSGLNWDDNLDKLNEECGVFGVYDPDGCAAELTYYGLFSLQHRGQEGCGIATSDGRVIRHYKNTGLVIEAIHQEDLDRLPGKFGIGHVRYSTSGGNSLLNTQPFTGYCMNGQLAVAHNGNLINAVELRKKLSTRGFVFQTTVDTESILSLIASYSSDNLSGAIEKTMLDLRGSYSMVILDERRLIAVRDPYGNRPLCIGRLPNGGYVVASESCAFDVVGASFERDVMPGEIFMVKEDGVTSISTFAQREQALCVFEYVYFARPDSNIDGLNVNRARKMIGKQLAKEAPLDVDIVIPVPDSGTTAAIGYSGELGLPFCQGILKNKYIGRTFIQPTQRMRELMVRLKLSPIAEELQGKRVAVVDDSIVRGTTSKRLVKLLREAGASEVHFLVASPEITWPCYYGIDTAERDSLLAVQKDQEDVREFVGADSVHFLSMEGLLEAVKGSRGYCTACFTGHYPMGCPNEENRGKDSFERS